MKRKTKTKNEFIQADAILTGDWHLREDTPVCRSDDFYENQWIKLDFISNLQKKHNCPIQHSGDLFDFWKPSPMLLSKTIEHLPAQFWTVHGNHCLPQHNLDLSHKSGNRVLEVANKINILNYNCHINNKFTWDGCHWLMSPIDCEKRANLQILVWHVMTYQGKKPWPNCTDPKGATLLRKYPQYNLIVTGHNHKPFVETYEGRLLVNPGSIFRMDADQIDHKPRVYLWFAKTNTVKAVYLPIESGVISREHIESKENRDNRINAFISTLDQDWEAEMSFEDNIEEFRKQNKIKIPIMAIIYKSMENETN